MASDSDSGSKGSEASNTTKTLLLGRREIEELFSMKEALKAVEDAFRLKAQGKTIMPAKIYLDLPEYHGDFRAMPAYIEGIAGIKWVSSYPENWKYNMPSVLATIILCDPKTSYPLAIMDGTYITSLRTGAAGGIAVKYLARRDSSTIGMIGAGKQAETQLLAISEVLPKIEEVRVFDQNEEVSKKYAENIGKKLNLNIRSVEHIAAAAEADIVVTTTPSRKPIIKKQYIRPGTHINAIGADAKEKQELESDLVASTKVIVDSIDQASHSGEINVPLSEGRLKVEDIYGTLGEVVAKMKQGRENDKEITIFDSTGLSIQDIACAKLVYEKAREKKVTAFELL